MAEDALRTIGVAYKEITDNDDLEKMSTDTT